MEKCTLSHSLFKNSDKTMTSNKLTKQLRLGIKTHTGVLYRAELQRHSWLSWDLFWPSCSQLSVISLLWSITLQQVEQLAQHIGGKRSNYETTTPYGPNPSPIHHPPGFSVNILTGNICELLKPASAGKMKVWNMIKKCQKKMEDFFALSHKVKWKHKRWLSVSSSLVSLL